MHFRGIIVVSSTQPRGSNIVKSLIRTGIVRGGDTRERESGISLYILSTPRVDLGLNYLRFIGTRRGGTRRCFTNPPRYLPQAALPCIIHPHGSFSAPGIFYFDRANTGAPRSTPFLFQSGSRARMARFLIRRNARDIPGPPSSTPRPHFIREGGGHASLIS